MFGGPPTEVCWLGPFFRKALPADVGTTNKYLDRTTTNETIARQSAADASGSDDDIDMENAAPSAYMFDEGSRTRLRPYDNHDDQDLGGWADFEGLAPPQEYP